MKTTIKFAMAAILICMIAACKKSSTGVEDPGESAATFTISGDIQGSRAGSAVFTIVGNPGAYYLEIWIHEEQVQGFSLDISLFMTQQVPPTGSYTISHSGFLGGDATADYLEFIDGPVPHIYSTKEEEGGYGGTLTLTESGANTIKGSFAFTAGRWHESTQSFIGEITISSGQFTATRDDD